MGSRKGSVSRSRRHRSTATPQHRPRRRVRSWVIPAGTTVASVGRRIGAYFLSILLVIVTLVIGYIVWGLIVWSKGTTPALQVLGMKVWRVDQPGLPGWGRMALREVVGRIVEGILGAITQIVSFVLFVSTEKRQALHDMIASTTVIHDPNKVLG
jgi:uncharacterized RDD family membrane protein YckC